MEHQLYLIGNPVDHSCSDLIHNTISSCLNLNYHYEILKLEPNEIENFINSVRKNQVCGFNVTIPYKKEIIPYLDQLNSDAKEIQAVNTVLNKNGKLIGYNTDAQGFLRALALDDVKINGKEIVLLGAGGAAHGICYALFYAGAKKITVLNRNQENARLLCWTFKSMGEIISKPLNDKPETADILVNTTSVGMKPAILESPITDLSFLKKDGYVCDIIYNPFETELLRMARDLKIKCQNGIYMLIYQAVIAYEIWSGICVPENVIQKIYQILNRKFNPNKI